MLDEADLLMEYNNDLSRKEAEKIIEKNKESRQEAVNEMFANGNPLENQEPEEESEENAQSETKD